MKSIFVILVGAAVLVGGCRREIPHTPMKLGADVGVTSIVAD